MQFSATVTGSTNQSVAWSVNGVANGNATVGTIDMLGNYQAPPSAPMPNSVTVGAVSAADKTLSATTPVTLENPIPVAQTVSPTLLPVGSFSLTVGGANFVPGSTVMFGGTALTTTYVSRTQLTATGTSTTAQKGTVAVTVTNLPRQIHVGSFIKRTGGHRRKSFSAGDPATAQVHVGATFNFRTAVDGAGTLTAVKWTVNGIPNGNATVGTVVPAEPIPHRSLFRTPT